jgi:hypothetical protein
MMARTWHSLAPPWGRRRTASQAVQDLQSYRAWVEAQARCRHLLDRLETAGLGWHELVAIVKELKPLAKHLQMLRAAHRAASGQQDDSSEAQHALQRLWDLQYDIQPYRPYRPPTYYRSRLGTALASVSVALTVWKPSWAGTGADRIHTDPLLD